MHIQFDPSVLQYTSRERTAAVVIQNKMSKNQVKGKSWPKIIIYVSENMEQSSKGSCRGRYNIDN